MRTCVRIDRLRPPSPLRAGRRRRWTGSAAAGAPGAGARARGRPEARVGAGPSRFCALAAATRARPRRPEVVAGDADAARAYLAPLPVSLLCAAGVDPELPATLERLGVANLGGLATLPRAAVADRFGEPGLHALDLVRGARGAPPPPAAPGGGGADPLPPPAPPGPPPPPPPRPLL